VAEDADAAEEALEEAAEAAADSEALAAEDEEDAPRPCEPQAANSAVPPTPKAAPKRVRRFTAELSKDS